MFSTASAVAQRPRNRLAVAFGLILYCSACWAVVAVVAETLYQYAAPPQASAEAEGVTGVNRTAR